MTLREMQSLHVNCTSALLEHILASGYELTWGETLRKKAEAEANAASGAGIAHSLHLLGLAIDLNLFKDGVWLTDSQSHAPFGAYWKSLHPLCRWGGDFKPKPDGNHYSVEWQGVK